MPPRVHVIACGALARELVEVVRVNDLQQVTVECLPAQLHNTPKLIPDAVRERIRAARGRSDRILVGYADCGTGGSLDVVCAEEGVTRLPGAHCYELFAGTAAFAAIQDREPGTFYLTDYLVRNFDRLVIAGLGLDRHPELHDSYFGNYRQLVHLTQTEDADLVERGRRAAERLGLRHVLRVTGYGGLEAGVVAFTQAAAASGALAGAAR
jgi:hypothetical protein